MPAGSKSKEERLVVVGSALGKLTPFTKYLDQFLDEYGYSLSVGYEAKRFIEIRFAKRFKYFETLSSDDLKGYIKERMAGSDGGQAWSVRSVEKI